MYADADPVDGENILIGFFNDEAYKLSIKAKEWVQVKLPMARFIEEMNGKGNFIPLNFNNAASGNHKNLTEVRVGKIEALRGYRVDADVTDVSATVTGKAVITVLGTDLPVGYELTVKNSAGAAVSPTQTSGNEYTFDNLSVGVYEYTVFDADNLFEPTKGMFTVQYASEPYMLLDTADPSALSQITPAGNAAEIADTAVTYVPASSGERAYFSIGQKDANLADSAHWRSFKLTPRYETAAYAGYDKVSVWVYLETSTGGTDEKVNLAFFNDVNYKFNGFNANT